MSVQEKMTDIADAIREKTGGTEPLTLDDMAASVPEVYEAGKTAEKEICDAQFFKTSFIGNNTTELKLSIPFLPDQLFLFTTSDYASARRKNTIWMIAMDTRSAAKYPSCIGQVTSAGQAGVSRVGGNSLPNCYSYENGVFTWKHPSLTVVFTSNARYFVEAVKFPHNSAKAVITEDVNLLPSGETGTVEYYASKVNQYFTSEEWAALIATKPKWTFSML